jgi:acyl carrier protein phosphodiesterase
LNFLGHAYIARNHPALIAGNFGGDSYKGSLDKFDLPKHIIDGVKLHRFIDNYTDQSQTILDAGHFLQSKGINKIAFIATDILLDHFLAREWINFSSKDYDTFIQEVYLHTEKYLDLLMPDFQGLYANLKEYGWLYDYPSEEGMRMILTQFSNRIRFENDLSECMDIYLKNQSLFDQLFLDFLIDIKQASGEFIAAL